MMPYVGTMPLWVNLIILNVKQLLSGMNKVFIQMAISQWYGWVLKLVEFASKNTLNRKIKIMKSSCFAVYGADL